MYVLFLVKICTRCRDWPIDDVLCPYFLYLLCEEQYLCYILWASPPRLYNFQNYYLYILRMKNLNIKIQILIISCYQCWPLLLYILIKFFSSGKMLIFFKREARPFYSGFGYERINSIGSSSLFFPDDLCWITLTSSVSKFWLHSWFLQLNNFSSHFSKYCSNGFPFSKRLESLKKSGLEWCDCWK